MRHVGLEPVKNPISGSNTAFFFRVAKHLLSTSQSLTVAILLHVAFAPTDQNVR